MLCAAGPNYSSWLDSYTAKFGKDPTFRERTEAFIASRTNTTPWWMTTLYPYLSTTEPELEN